MGRTETWIARISLGVLVLGALILYAVPDARLTPLLQNMSALSTLLLVILTATYVYTTNRQLLVMIRQLSETQRNRELEQQPLPWVEVSKVYIERPRVFTDGPGGEVHVGYRIHVLYEARNVGNGAAIGIDIIPRLFVKQGEGDYIGTCIAKRVEILERGQAISKGLVSTFARDRQFTTIKNLLEGYIDNFPTLSLTVLFKNFLGATFKTESTYTLFPHEDDYNIIKDWLVNLTNMSVELSIYTTKALLIPELADGLFESAKKEWDGVDLLGDGDVMLGPVLMPNSFEVSEISKDCYEEYRKGIGYGKTLGVVKPKNPESDQVKQ